ncbi:nitroreductase family deazaflavin-dependent oxidoreductase [Nocardia harenae]|uniref:nitroreductase family deazaflavin-dependent oxidoreductase n=1 Tax=Nocardia harenae TaxID=358707 RepID=UPI0008379CA8|nr:nitroreductase family deazaflavin-dependent oxidoreductase [Nocardia harenae]
MAEDFNTKIIAEFRANQGRVGGPFEGAELLLLTTTGAKSGAQRVSPLALARDGERLVIAASKAGADTNPDWYHNVRANPEVTVELGTETFRAVATPIESGPERDRLYGKLVELMPGFAEYETKTDRVIPVVVLERA